ncbi:MAG: MBL fold metallo-hydrolase [Pseudomonadota bacterium]
MTNTVSRPHPSELEVSLFGGDFGESVVMHLGADCWVVVDSCAESGSDESTPLKYLDSLGINIKRQVKLVVITHWHDDHIRGISTVVRECHSATIAMSSAFRMKDFLEMVDSGSEAAMVTRSGVDEFAAILGILEQRKGKRRRYNPPKMALRDRLLYRQQIALQSGVADAAVWSLSPSDSATILAQREFAEKSPKKGHRPGWIPSGESNHSSVVLWVTIGDNKILLGADMERTGDESTGWSAILGGSGVVDGKADIFKVPHHGAESGDHPKVWSELLHRDPFAILTAFRNGKVLLPTQDDVRRINSRTCNAYITATPAPTGIKGPRQRVVREALKRTTRTLTRAQLPSGHIRLRRHIDGPTGPWRRELFGNANPLAHV